MDKQQPIQKTFNFKSGVTVETNNKKVTAIGNNYNKTIQSEDLDNLSYSEISQQRLSFWGVLARMFAIGLLLIIVSKVLFSKLNLENQSVYLGVILMGISFLGLMLFVVDLTLELGIADNIMNNYFSNKGYYVVIGNKSGNNIEFYAQLEDVEQIKELESKIYELKKSAVRNDRPIVQAQTSNLDELKKLSELLKDGIIEQEEFDKKKKQLLELN